MQGLETKRKLFLDGGHETKSIYKNEIRPAEPTSLESKRHQESSKTIEISNKYNRRTQQDTGEINKTGSKSSKKRTAEGSSQAVLKKSNQSGNSTVRGKTCDN